MPGHDAPGACRLAAPTFACEESERQMTGDGSIGCTELRACNRALFGMDTDHWRVLHNVYLG